MSIQTANNSPVVKEQDNLPRQDQAVLKIARDPANWSPGAQACKACLYIECTCKIEDEPETHEKFASYSPDLIQYSMSTTEQKLQNIDLVENYLSDLENADENTISALLEKAPDLYTALIRSGAQISGDKLGKTITAWGVKLPEQNDLRQAIQNTGNNTSEAETQNTTNQSSSEEIDHFNIIAGHTDLPSRINNLLQNGQPAKAVELLQAL